MNTFDISGKQKEYIESIRSMEKKYLYRSLAHAFAHNILHFTIFVGAVIVPFLLQLKVDTLIITIVSAIVAVAAALTQFFQFGDRRRIYRLAADGLRREINYFDVRGGEHRNLKPDVL